MCADAWPCGGDHSWLKGSEGVVSVCSIDNRLKSGWYGQFRHVPSSGIVRASTTSREMRSVGRVLNLMSLSQSLSLCLGYPLLWKYSR